MQTARVKMNENGRVVIPVEFRKELGMKPGDQLVLELKGRELRLMTFRERIARVQALVAEHIPAGRSLSKELIAERREEARREEEKG
jgi:AbrB family looped-hinge helix DNA binding protein